MPIDTDLLGISAICILLVGAVLLEIGTTHLVAAFVASIMIMTAMELARPKPPTVNHYNFEVAIEEESEESD